MEFIPLGADHEFVKPKREILSPDDLVKWPKSEAYNEFLQFMARLNNVIMGKKLSHPITPSQNLTSILGVLSKLSEWIDQTPPIDQPQRFGNKAFKTWFTLLTDNIHEVLRLALDKKYYPALDEITIYLIESFGNSTRIDYGSGHEMNFVLFLYCLFRVGILDWSNPNDQLGSVLKIFAAYMTLARKLQITYRMEPAGSHGAWSLDDYQFIPFIWGSAQLIRNEKIEPTHMTDAKIVEEAKSDYLFFSCIDYILQVKTGPFHEHSNQLWNISGIESWTKVNTGLIKMYKAEIISKFPIIQHTLFGSLVRIKPMEMKPPSSMLLSGSNSVPPPKFRVPEGPRAEPPKVTAASDQTPHTTSEQAKSPECPETAAAGSVSSSNQMDSGST